VSAASEAGLTIIEVVIAASLAVVLLAGAGNFILASLRQANAASSRVVTARGAELFLARLTREVREAQYIQTSSTGADTTPVNVTYGSGSSSVSFYIPNAGSSSAGTQVTWTCTAEASCTRKAGGGTAVTQLTGVKSATFRPLASSGSELSSGAGANGSYPSSILMTLSVKDISQLDREHSHTVEAVKNPIVVQDGVDLRNYS
jgi:Tfp pilus assembly protein PilV